MGEMLKYAAKWATLVAMMAVFTGLLATLGGAIVSVLVSIDPSQPALQFVKLVSKYLPFDAGDIFSGVLTVIVACFSGYASITVYNWLITKAKDM